MKNKGKAKARVKAKAHAKTFKSSKHRQLAKQKRTKKYPSRAISKTSHSEQYSESETQLQTLKPPFKNTPEEKTTIATTFHERHEHHPQPPPSAPSRHVARGHHLPHSYNVTKLVLMTRDPYCVFCYWDFSGDTWNWIQGLYREQPGQIRSILRIHDVTDIEFNGANANYYYDLDISLEARNWYVHVNVPNCEWVFDLALIDSSGRYYLIARGNRVRTPRDGPSDVIDENWLMIDFDRLYALSGGFGIGLSSGEIRKMIKERYLIQKALFSGSLGSGNAASKPPLPT